MQLFDESVADGVRRGDPDAIGTVYACLSDRLMGYLVTRVRDRPLAEDLLIQTFMELIERGHTITGGPRAIKVWLFRAAHFNLLDHVRKVKRHSEDLTDDLVVLDSPDESRGPAELAEVGDLCGEVRAAMDQLSPDQQEVLALRYVAGLSAPEVATVTNRTDGAVRSLQHRGERSLARILEMSEAAPDGAAGASKPRQQ